MKINIIHNFKYLLAIILISQGLLSYSQENRKLIREGNNKYEDTNFSESELSYRKALEKDSKSFKAGFNLGDALYKQEKFEEAAEQFKSLSNLEISKEDKAKTFHNLGNSLLQSKDEEGQPKLEEAIDAYKNALRNNPSDKATKYNLAFANALLQKQQQQQQQNQDDKNKDNKDNKDKKDKQDKKSDDKKDQDKKDEQKQDKSDEQKQNEDKKEEQKPEPKEDKISKEDAERLLKSIENDEKKIQEDLKKAQVKTQKGTIEKDW